MISHKRRSGSTIPASLQAGGLPRLNPSGGQFQSQPAGSPGLRQSDLLQFASHDGNFLQPRSLQASLFRSPTTGVSRGVFCHSAERFSYYNRRLSWFPQSFPATRSSKSPVLPLGRHGRRLQSAGHQLLSLTLLPAIAIREEHD
jgi:hypothetical protein